MYISLVLFSAAGRFQALVPPRPRTEGKNKSFQIPPGPGKRIVVKRSNEFALVNLNLFRQVSSWSGSNVILSFRDVLPG